MGALATFWIFIPLAFILVGLIGGVKRRRLLMFPLLMALLLIAGSLLFFILLPMFSPPPFNVAFTEENGQVKLTEYANILHPNAPDPSLDALWDKLTKSRIKLDGEAETSPLADPKDEEAKQAVRETFGLDAEGNMPPEWVITPPKRIGRVYRESVASDPFVTEAECRRQLEQEQLPAAVSRRIEHLVSARRGQSVRINHPLEIGIGLDYILREMCRDEFTATVDSSVGEMKKIHVLLESPPQVDQYLTAAWLEHERHERFTYFGKIATMSLIGLASIYGLLRFDTWSQGYYSKQLLVGGVLAIIAFAVVFLK